MEASTDMGLSDLTGNLLWQSEIEFLISEECEEPNEGSSSPGILGPKPGQQMTEDSELIVANHTNGTRVGMETNGEPREASMVSALREKGVHDTKLFDKMSMWKVANFAEVGQGLLVVLNVGDEIQRFGEMPTRMDTLVFQTDKSTMGAKQLIDSPSTTNMDQFLTCLKTDTSLDGGLSWSKL
ncbi:hypothetical protein GQ457_14G013130 [Hibiscus cannabinus]